LTAVVDENDLEVPVRAAAQAAQAAAQQLQTILERDDDADSPGRGARIFLQGGAAGEGRSGRAVACWQDPALQPADGVEEQPGAGGGQEVHLVLQALGAMPLLEMALVEVVDELAVIDARPARAGVPGHEVP